MNATLLNTKLHRPPVTPGLVRRPRLIKQLNRGLSGPLTLVCAGAGTGKTTLVSSWLEEMTARGSPSAPAAWLSLDEHDSDLVVFVRYWIAALRTMVTEACAETLALLQASQPPPPDVLLATLSNEIELLPGRFILVLDDYHAIRSEAVHQLLGELLRHWPRPLHLVLISRTSPPLPLASLRARGIMAEIRSRDLRFTEEETAAYMSQALDRPLDQAAIRLLEEHTEGWITALRLAALWMRRVGNPEAVLGALTRADADVAEYLLDEILSRQVPAIQTFLLKTSILDRWCASLCEAVLGEGDPAWSARACIDWLERADLFITPLDDHREWYRYHHLFRDSLKRRLAGELGPGRVADLHCRAADWFAQRGLAYEGVGHALEANDLDQASRLIKQGLYDVLNRDDRPTLERWLRLLPDDLIERRPWLLMVKVWAIQFSFNMNAISHLLPQVEALIEEDGGETHDADDVKLLRGQVALLRGQQAYFSNQPTQAVNHCREVLALLPSSWRYVRGGAMLYLGLSMQANGQGQVAERLLLDQYQRLDNKIDGYALRHLMALCFNYLHEGHLEQTRQTARLLLHGATRGGLAIQQGWAHYFLGLVHYQWNDLDTVGVHFRQLLNERHKILAACARDGMAGLARVHQARGEFSAAWQVADILRQFDLEQSGYQEERTRSLRARLMLLQGDVESARRWADAFTAPVPDQPLVWLEQPHITKATILLGRGNDADVPSALQILDGLDEVAQRTHNTRYKIEILALRALALDVQGKTDDAGTALQQAVDLSRAGGFLRVFVDLGPRMQAMLGRLAGQGPAAETIGRILAAFPGDEFSMVIGDQEARPARSGRWPLNVPTLVEPLTARELEILALLREPLSTKEIAHRLDISYLTVKRHRVNLYGKLGVHTRWDAVARATDLGILSPR